MKLYEINAELAKALNIDDETWVNGETGEVIDKAALDALKMERGEKLENLSCAVLQWTSDADQLKELIKAYQDRLKKLLNRIDGAKSYLVSQMEPGEKINTARIHVSWRHSQSVELKVDPQVLPEGYVKREVTYKADKMAIKKALKGGDKTLESYAALVDSMSIQIKP